MDKMEQDPLAHTKKIENMLRHGWREEAAIEHNAHVADTFARAQAGEVICLSDLIGGAEALHIDRVGRKQGRR